MKKNQETVAVLPEMLLATTELFKREHGHEPRKNETKSLNPSVGLRAIAQDLQHLGYHELWKQKKGKEKTHIAEIAKTFGYDCTVPPDDPPQTGVVAAILGHLSDLMDGVEMTAQTPKKKRKKKT